MGVSVATSDIERELRINDAVAGAMTPVMVFAIYASKFVIFTQVGYEYILGIPGIPFAVIILLTLFGLRFHFRFRHKARPTRVSKRRIRILSLSAVLLGSVWGLLSLSLLSVGNTQDKMVVVAFACMAGFASVGINSVPVALGFSLPIMLITWGSVLWFDVFNGFVATLMFGLGSGSIIQFALAARKTTVASIKLSLANTQALSDQLKAEEQLRLSEAKAALAEQKRQADAAKMQRNMINAISFPMVLSHGNDALEVTPAGREQFKIADGPLENVAISDFFVNPEDQAEMINMLEQYGKIDNFELLMHDAEGGEFWTVASMRPLKYDGKDCWLNSIYVIDARKRMEQDLAAAKDAAEETLEKLKTTQDSLVHAEKMASLGQLTAGIAHEIKNPLNFVNNFSKLSIEMLDELSEILTVPLAALEEDDKEDAEDLFQTVRDNLTKIEGHGKRADSIIKNMLLHSRQGPGEKQKINLNNLAEEAMNLAYHGARAADSTFNVEMKTDFSSEVVPIDCHPQELQRVFLNLCSNGMYEAVKSSIAGGDEPVLSIRSVVEAGNIIVEVTDNGRGVPEDIRDKIFQPFFTTKPTGEGTGLGLSMSYDIVKQHGGELKLESEVGKGTTFRMIMPVNLTAEASQ